MNVLMQRKHPTHLPIPLTSSPTNNTANNKAKCTVTLQIKPNVPSELEKVSHMQCFCFRSFISGLGTDGNKSITIRYEIVNADSASFPSAWPGTTVCYTSKSLDTCDDDCCKRNLTTDYIDGKLCWTHEHEGYGSTFFSYWPPYTYNRHLRLIISDCTSHMASLQMYNPSVESLGKTTEGREMECIFLGNGELVAWIIHQQPPGETMAEFFAEGLLHRLFGLDATPNDEVKTNILTNYRLHIIPFMCPDGSVRGHIRTNAKGANLNREWATLNDYDAPTLSHWPEVYCVLNKMDETGCDFFLDVHGDEELPYVFFNGLVMTPKWGERMKNLHGYFVSCYMRANGDVQKEFGYAAPTSLGATIKTMNKASKQVSNRFDCLGLTLEMPYKDCATNSDPEYGFCPHRTKQLGRNILEALDSVFPYLRAEGEFWSAFGAEDRFVLPRDPTGAPPH